jgi:hypothetical protein
MEDNFKMIAKTFWFEEINKGITAIRRTRRGAGSKNGEF